MGVLKKHNTLVLEYDIEGLPRDWRDTVESTVRHVGKLFDLYVTTVKAGHSGNPPSILVSVSREGSEEAWTQECQSTLRARIAQQLDYVREEESERRAEIEALEAQLAGGMRKPRHHRFPAAETPRAPALQKGVDLRRSAVLGELRAKLVRARLPPPVRDLVNVALDRMKQSDRWALWAQTLVTVTETADVIGHELEARLRGLL
jgi:hypothetical protein